VVELEQEFGVSFPTYLLSELLDADRIAKEIRNLQ
jgi:acyl carrier protein